MSYRFIIWMAVLLVISVIVEACGFLFGQTDFDPGHDGQGGTTPKDY